MQIRSLEIVKSSGPVDYDYLTLEILLNSEPILAIDQEKGADLLVAEVFGKYAGYGSGVKVSLDDLIDALIEARKAINSWNVDK